MSNHQLKEVNMATNVERWQKEAREQDMHFVEYRVGETNVYLLSCGHEQRLTPNQVTSGEYECSVCKMKKVDLDLNY